MGILLDLNAAYPAIRRTRYQKKSREISWGLFEQVMLPEYLMIRTKRLLAKSFDFFL